MEGTSKANIINVSCISCGLRPRFKLNKLEKNTSKVTPKENLIFHNFGNEKKVAEISSKFSKSSSHVGTTAIFEMPIDSKETTKYTEAFEN
jgi:hypothetical protein